MQKDTILEMPVRNFMHIPPVMIREDDEVGDILQSLRELNCSKRIMYFYVVNSEDALEGVVSTRSLLLASPEEKAKNIMDRTIISLEENTSFEKAMKSLSQHHLLALPVVDRAKKLIGFFDVQMCLDENIDLLKERKSHEIFQLLGMRIETTTYRHPFQAYTKRMPWILCNMVGGIACAAISYAFKLVLGQVLLLAMFIVLALSESISMQSMTQSLQILKKHSLPFKKILSRVFFEIRVAALMSITSAILVGFLSLLWSSAWPISGVIAVGIAVSVVLSAVLGASIPIILHINKLDPKVASGPVALTIADVVTTTIYLAMATWWLI
jgi:magnesium transporter